MFLYFEKSDVQWREGQIMTIAYDTIFPLSEITENYCGSTAVQKKSCKFYSTCNMTTS